MPADQTMDHDSGDIIDDEPQQHDIDLKSLQNALQHSPSLEDLLQELSEQYQQVSSSAEQIVDQLIATENAAPTTTHDQTLLHFAVRNHNTTEIAK